MMDARIQVFSEVDGVNPFQAKNLEKAICEIERDQDVNFDSLNFVLMPTDQHTSMNLQYLNHDYETDVITFDLSSAGEQIGEVYINHEVAKNNAAVYGVSLDLEIHRLAIHGVLHLVGFNDSNDQEKSVMKEKEDYYLTRFM